jgi:hypothetical protein
MYVPNYIPEPLEVPGNVTEDPYPLRVRFIRRVALLHLGSIAVLALLTNIRFPIDGIWLPLLALSACLIGLDLLRIAIRGRDIEAKVSSVGIVPILFLGAWVIRAVQEAGFPVFQAVIGSGCVVVYTFMSGRDFSFVGCCMLSLIASSAAVAAMSSAASFDRLHAAFALGSNAIVILYLVYDLASLMARRRRGEELAAVVDLYRDIFNFFGYAVRMVKHWRKHRIWTIR